MLIIEDNSVYEIDEECLRRKKVPKECKTYQKLCHEKSKDRAGGNEEPAPKP